MNMLGRLAGLIETLNEYVGRAVSWLALSMVLVTFSVAMLRYGFDIGWVWLQETYVWMHGAIIMLAVAYTFLHEGHVRVDVYYRGASPRYRAWVDLLGTLFLLFPMLGVVTWYTLPYVAISWQRLEASREAGGLPGLYLLKSTIAAFCLLLFLQGLAVVIRSLQTLRDKPSGSTESAAKGAQ